MPLVTLPTKESGPVKTPLQLWNEKLDLKMTSLALALIEEFNGLMTFVWENALPPDAIIESLGTRAGALFAAAEQMRNLVLFAAPNAELKMPPYDKWSLTFNKDGSATATEIIPEPEPVVEPEPSPRPPLPG